MEGPRRIVEIKSIKGVILKKLFEVVKQFVKDTTLVFTSEGIKTSFVDSSENSLTFLNLYADKFEVYKCEKEVRIGINVSTFFKTFKSVSRRDIITMYINEGEEENFYIEFHDPYIAKSKTFKMEALILKNEDIDMQPISFDCVISISTLQFQQIIKDVKLIEGCVVDIKSVSKMLIITSSDGIVEFTTSISEIADEQEVVDDTINEDSSESETAVSCKTGIKFNNTDNDKIIQGKFKMSYLSYFIKASHLCDNMNILLSNDEPMILEYFVADLGSLRFVLVPM